MVKPVKKFVGLGNYISVLKDPEYMENLWQYILVHRDSSGV